MAHQKLTEMDTSALKPGVYFKASRRWYLADGEPEMTSSNPAYPEYRIPAYDTNGIRMLVTYLPDRVDTTRGGETPESFKQHKLLAHARELEDAANGILGRVARIRQFAAKLENKEV